jgi:hypothetical protein
LRVSKEGGGGGGVEIEEVKECAGSAHQDIRGDLMLFVRLIQVRSWDEPQWDSFSSCGRVNDTTWPAAVSLVLCGEDARMLDCDVLGSWTTM